MKKLSDGININEIIPFDANITPILRYLNVLIYPLLFIFATFKNTTKSDVYRVTLENGTSTIGYTENGNLVIEIPTSDGNYKKEVFTAK
jgi:hypothetical protein